MWYLVSIQLLRKMTQKDERREENGGQSTDDPTHVTLLRRRKTFTIVLFTRRHHVSGAAQTRPSRQTCVPWLIAHTRWNTAGAKNQVKANAVVGLHAARQADSSPTPENLNPFKPCLLSTLLVFLPGIFLHTDPLACTLCAPSALRVMHGSTTQQHHSPGNLSSSKEMLVPRARHMKLAGRTLRVVQCVFYPP